MNKKTYRRKKKTKKIVKSKNNIKLKIKNLANIKKKVRTRKNKRIQYGCKNMKGGNAMLNLDIGNNISHFIADKNNILGGHTGNELYKGLASYP